MFVYMPKEKASKAYKFARPFYGLYRVVEVLETGLVVRPVDRPEGETMQVACNRVRDAVPDKEFWPPRRTARDQKRPAMETLRDTPKEIPGETLSVEETSERSYSNQVGQGRPPKEWGHVTLELRTGSDDISSNMCGFISSHLSLFKCTFL